jgi:hypothetical protein
MAVATGKKYLQNIAAIVCFFANSSFACLPLSELFNVALLEIAATDINRIRGIARSPLPDRLAGAFLVAITINIDGVRNHILRARIYSQKESPDILAKDSQSEQLYASQN